LHLIKWKSVTGSENAGDNNEEWKWSIDIFDPARGNTPFKPQQQALREQCPDNFPDPEIPKILSGRETAVGSNII
jgi:hypothetical protein